MPDKKAVRTHVTRAGVGLAITAGAVGAIVLLGSFAMPTIELTPTAATVDTAQNATRTLACAGSALELGADPSRPLLAIPSGSTSVTVQNSTGNVTSTTSFARESESSSGVMLQLDGEQLYEQALSESQQLQTGAFQGLLATQCIEATNETWIVGGTTTVGSVTILSLTNPGDVPATVFVNVFDAEGPVDSLQSAGTVVPPRSQRTVSLNGAAPDRESIAVQVLSRGAKVVATMQESLVEGLTPVGVDTVQGIDKPQKQLVIPGITTPVIEGVSTVDQHGHDHAEHTIRLLAPGEQGGTATITAVNAEGKTLKLANKYLQPGEVTEIALEKLTNEYTTVLVDAEVPVVASVTGVAHGTSTEDITWFTAAREITREIPLAVPAGPDAQLTLYNPNDTAVTVDLSLGDGKVDQDTVRVKIPAKSSIRQAVNAGAGYQLLPSGTIYAGLSFAGDGLLSGFPVAAPLASANTVSVYTR